MAAKKQRHKADKGAERDENFDELHLEVMKELKKCDRAFMEFDILKSILYRDQLKMVEQREKILKDLIDALSTIFENVKVHPFGSSVSGLAFSGSDFDFFIEVADDGKTTTQKAIKKTHYVLGEKQLFTKLTKILNARVPLLKCFHQATGFDCDLNFTNYMGVLNTKIMAHLLAFDDRMFPLATIMKYWLKLHGCSGLNFISNYAGLWMLFFYLQTMPSPILPPIADFQRGVEPKMWSEHYNFAFDFEKKNETTNKMTVNELLNGFFQFYKTFDFATQLICPLHGKQFSKSDVNKENLTEFVDYREKLKSDPDLHKMSFNKPICIQDPFEINRTIPGEITLKRFKEIQLKIQIAADITDEYFKANNRQKLLTSLFDKARFDEIIAKKKEAEQKIKNEQKQKQRQLAEPKFIHSEVMSYKQMNGPSSLLSKDPQVKLQMAISATNQAIQLISTSVEAVANAKELVSGVANELTMNLSIPEMKKCIEGGNVPPIKKQLAQNVLLQTKYLIQLQDLVLGFYQPTQQMDNTNAKDPDQNAKDQDDCKQKTSSHNDKVVNKKLSKNQKRALRRKGNRKKPINH